MIFDPPLEAGTLVRRYKRFLADVRRDDGTVVTMHCPNTGAMLGLTDPGNRVWFSTHGGTARKYRHTLEIVATAAGNLVGIHSARANALVAEALATRSIGDLSVPEDGVRVEVRMDDGRVLTKSLDHSLGNLERPLSDAQLEAKFRDQAGVLPAAQVDALIADCWRIETLDLSVGPFDWAFAHARRAEIDAHFEMQRRDKPGLWNGRVLLMHRYEIAGACLRDHGGKGPPAVFIPSLINPPNILDLDSEVSLAAAIAAMGRRVLLLDWGKADARSQLSVAGHVEHLLLPLLRSISEPAALIGYCLGGTMAMAAANLVATERVITLAAPWNFAQYPEASRAALRDMWTHSERAAEPITSPATAGMISSLMPCMIVIDANDNSSAAGLRDIATARCNNPRKAC